MKLKIITLFFLISAIASISCSREDNTGQEYEYTYQLTGPSSNKLIVQYTPTMIDPNITEIPDDLEYEEQVSPPWQKTVRLHKNVGGVGFSARVSEGVQGASYTISILDKDAKTLRTTTFIVDTSGDGGALLNYYRN